MWFSTILTVSLVKIICNEYFSERRTSTKNHLLMDERVRIVGYGRSSTGLMWSDSILLPGELMHDCLGCDSRWLTGISVNALVVVRPFSGSRLINFHPPPYTHALPTFAIPVLVPVRLPRVATDQRLMTGALSLFSLKFVWLIIITIIVVIVSLNSNWIVSFIESTYRAPPSFDAFDVKYNVKPSPNGFFLYPVYTHTVRETVSQDPIRSSVIHVTWRVAPVATIS